MTTEFCWEEWYYGEFVDLLEEETKASDLLGAVAHDNVVELSAVDPDAEVWEYLDKFWSVTK